MKFGHVICEIIKDIGIVLNLYISLILYILFLSHAPHTVCHKVSRIAKVRTFRFTDIRYTNFDK